MAKVGLSRHARFSQIPYIAEDGSTKYYPTYAESAVPATMEATPDAPANHSAQLIRSHTWIT